MGAGEELRGVEGRKGSPNQDILQEKKEGKIINLKITLRKEAEIHLQYPGSQEERSEVVKSKHYCAQLHHLVNVAGNCI